jgi:outer membrane protein assembly factor BamB
LVQTAHLALPRFSRRGFAGVAITLIACSFSACVVDGPLEQTPGTRDTIRVAWRTPLVGNTGTLDLLASDGLRLFTLVDGVSAYDLGTGARLWRAPRAPIAPPNVVSRDGRVFVSSSAAIALDAGTGAELWRFHPDTTSDALSAVDGRAFYIGSDTGTVYALDVRTGQPFWSAEAVARGTYRTDVTSILSFEDVLYVSVIEETSPTGHLKRGWMVAMDRFTGRVLWRYRNERPNEPHDARRRASGGVGSLASDE